MKIAARSIVALLIALGWSLSHAQVPAIIGTWKLNVEASKFPGPPPQTHVRSYRLGDDGVLIGVAVIVDAQGRPNFLQFAAKVDGKDYPEFSMDSAGKYLSDGTKPPRTYAEIPTNDPLRVKWVDKMGGKVLFSGEKWVSADGKRMSFTVVAKEGEALYVFDRTGS